MAFGPCWGQLADRSDKLRIEIAVIAAVASISCLMALAMVLSWPSDIEGVEVIEAAGPRRSEWLAAIYVHLTVIGISCPVIQVTHFPRINQAAYAVHPELATSAMACGAHQNMVA